MTDDEPARELAALRAFAQWRARTLVGIVSAFALGGLAMVGFFWWLASSINAVVRSWPPILGGAAVTWAVFSVVGLAVARGVSRARTPQRLQRLAAAHGIPVDRLARSIGVQVERRQP
jgi:hypothetical protein